MVLQNFLNNFTEAQATISQASAAAAETARQKAMDAYETATRMKLNVRIKAPIIIVPIGSEDTNALSLDLGLLELTNNTVEVAVPNEERLAVIDEIKLHICDVKISKVVLLDGNESTVDGNYFESGSRINALKQVLSFQKWMLPWVIYLNLI